MTDPRPPGENWWEPLKKQDDAADAEMAALSEFEKERLRGDMLKPENWRLRNLRSVAEHEPEAPYIYVVGRGFLRVVQPIVYELTKPGPGLGNPMSFTNKARKLLFVHFHYRIEDGGTIIWAGEAKNAEREVTSLLQAPAYIGELERSGLNSK